MENGKEKAMSNKTLAQIHKEIVLLQSARPVYSGDGRGNF